jgi:hypothetical protein
MAHQLSTFMYTNPIDDSLGSGKIDQFENIQRVSLQGSDLVSAVALFSGTSIDDYGFAWLFIRQLMLLKMCRDSPGATSRTMLYPSFSKATLSLAIM